MSQTQIPSANLRSDLTLSFPLKIKSKFCWLIVSKPHNDKFQEILIKFLHYIFNNKFPKHSVNKRNSGKMGKRTFCQG